MSLFYVNPEFSYDHYGTDGRANTCPSSSEKNIVSQDLLGFVQDSDSWTYKGIFLIVRVDFSIVTRERFVTF